MLSFVLIGNLMSSGYCLYTRGSLAWMRLSLFTFSRRGPVPFVGPAGAGGRRNGCAVLLCVAAVPVRLPPIAPASGPP